MAAKTYNIPELDKKLADRRYHLSDTNPEFTKNILKTSRTIANMCYQCGTCTGSCPSAPRSSYRIRLFMRRCVLGLENEALTDPDLWLCTTCYSCTDRCPRDIAPTDVIMAMRNLAFKRDIVQRTSCRPSSLFIPVVTVVPNNDVNRAARTKLGLPADPPTTHSYPEFIKGIQKIMDHYELKENADRILKGD
jgi:heterodisulfide reductase subunit C